MDTSLAFDPCQIVYLEHGQTRLYAEVIQTVTERHICWVRPLMLKISTDEEWERSPHFTNTELLNSHPPQLYDLRQGADLLWPIRLFQAALDTEVIPLLAQLYSMNSPPEGLRQGQIRLRQFVQQLWQAYPSLF